MLLSVGIIPAGEQVSAVLISAKAHCGVQLTQGQIPNIVGEFLVLASSLSARLSVC